MSKLGIAVVGFGYWGPNLVRNFQRHPECSVRWICDTSPERLATAAQEWGQARGSQDLSEALADDSVDLVAIATPIATHYALAKAALEAGKHVLVEKPMTGDVAQAEELVALAEAKGLLLFVDHTYLFTSEVRYIKKALVGGDLGKLLYMDVVRINLGLFQRDHDVVWDLAPHDMSIFLYLLGRLPKSVLATGAAHTESGLADVAMLHMDFGDGLVANVHVSWLSPVKIRHTILAGRKQMLVYNDLNPAEKIHIYDRGIDVSPDAESKRQVLVDYRRGDMRAPHIPSREALRSEVDEIVACVRGKGEPTSSGSLGLEVVRLLSALSLSLAEDGKRVVLGQ